MKNNPFHPKFRLNDNTFTSVASLLNFAQFDKRIYSFLKDWFATDDFITLQTSGTTGLPKSICLKKEWMINSAKTTCFFLNLDKDTTALLCLSCEYIAGKMMLVRAMILGWQLDIISPIANPLEKIEKTYDFSAFVPMQLYHSLTKLHRIKKLIVGGGMISKALITSIQSVKTEIFQTYGMTETCTHIAIRKLNHFSDLEKISDKSYFKIFSNITISQDDRDCLTIEAPKISAGKIVTNDIVRLISKTEFEWLGRFDNIINSGGVKLHPEKIEQKLSCLIKSRFFVAGIPDKILGERLILIVEQDNASKDDHHALRDKIAKLPLIQPYEIPKSIYFVNHFAETDTKKIQRKKTVQLIRL